MMKPEIKELWIAALRNPSNEQTTHVLEKDGRYCCLGLLCETIHEDPHIGWMEDFKEEALSSDQRFEFGISSFEQITLVSMNDGIDESSKSFREIADWIEKNL